MQMDRATVKESLTPVILHPWPVPCAFKDSVPNPLGLLGTVAIRGDESAGRRSAPRVVGSRRPWRLQSILGMEKPQSGSVSTVISTTIGERQ